MTVLGDSPGVGIHMNEEGWEGFLRGAYGSVSSRPRGFRTRAVMLNDHREREYSDQTSTETDEINPKIVCISLANDLPR